MQLPTDVFQNPDIQQLFQEVQAYQQQFVLLHKASTANQPQGEDPAALKARLLQLDSQKQQLKDKLTKARAKVANVPNLTMLQVWRHVHTAPAHSFAFIHHYTADVLLHTSGHFLAQW